MIEFEFVLNWPTNSIRYAINNVINNVYNWSDSRCNGVIPNVDDSIDSVISNFYKRIHDVNIVLKHRVKGINFSLLNYWTRARVYLLVYY